MLQWKKTHRHNRNPKNFSAVKYTSFQRFWNGKLFLVYSVYPKKPDFFVRNYPDNGRLTDEEKTAG